MVDANLRILINAVDKASPQLKGITGALQGIAGSVAPMAIAGAAIGAVATWTRKAVEETQTYNLEMLDLSKKMGVTTEEASRLVQVGDDLRISSGQITTAMQFLARQGVDPSIDSIAKLAGEYTALQSPAEKAQLLLKNFGRTGMDMGRLLEKGEDAVREMAGAIDDGLIVTEEAAEASERYYEAQDKLKEVEEGLARTVGNEVIPVWTQLLIKVTESIPIYKGVADQIKIITDYYAQLAFGIVPAENQSMSLRAEIERLNQTQKEEEAIIYDNIVAWGEATGNLDIIEQGFIDTRSSILGTREAFRSMNDIELNFGDKILTELDKIKFRLAGGEDLQAAADAVYDALETGKIDEATGQEMLSGLFVASEALKVKMGEITATEAANNIKTELGGSFTDAKAKLDEVTKGLTDIPAETKKKLSVEVNAYWNATAAIPPGIAAQIMQIAQTAVASGEDVEP